MTRFMLSFFVFTALVFCAQNAHAVDYSKAYLNNQSNYVLVRTSEWNISQGTLVWQDAKLPYAKGFNKLVSVRFDYEGLIPDWAEAHATYSYYAVPDFVKQGECVFEFRTQDKVWNPSFLNSHCTGPIHLSLIHRGGGISMDNYIYELLG
ncbi:MAG: hypothetical protein HY939_03500 [Gammaproteobacteria bacterium]|nr:hypothetical protein [Gammaproteobacteria bacterium]